MNQILNDSCDNSACVSPPSPFNPCFCTYFAQRDSRNCFNEKWKIFFFVFEISRWKLIYPKHEIPSPINDAANLTFTRHRHIFVYRKCYNAVNAAKGWRQNSIRWVSNANGEHYLCCLYLSEKVPRPLHFIPCSSVKSIDYRTIAYKWQMRQSLADPIAYWWSQNSILNHTKWDLRCDLNSI